MKQIAWNLEANKGHSVIQCVYNEKGAPCDEVNMENLNIAHRKKIEIADAVYIVDIDKYLGESTKSEIRYAQERGMKVIFHSEGSKDL